MIVPFAKGQAKGQPAQQPQPSETDMLMALATMHKLGTISKSKGTPAPSEPSPGA
jgi:hypothetical protein